MNKPSESSQATSRSASSEIQQRIEAIGDQLRSKISSKFQASTFLAGFAATILTIQITILWQDSPRPQLLPLAIGIITAAIILFVIAIIKLDELTMPKRFWKEDEAFKDPLKSQMAFLTDEDLWELRKRMIFYWGKFTIAATVLAAASLVCMLLSLNPVDSRSNLVETSAVWVGVAVLLTVIYCAVVSRKARQYFEPLMRPSD